MSAPDANTPRKGPEKRKEGDAASDVSVDEPFASPRRPAADNKVTTVPEVKGIVPAAAAPTREEKKSAGIMSAPAQPKAAAGVAPVPVDVLGATAAISNAAIAAAAIAMDITASPVPVGTTLPSLRTALNRLTPTQLSRYMSNALFAMINAKRLGQRNDADEFDRKCIQFYSHIKTLPVHAEILIQELGKLRALYAKTVKDKGECDSVGVFGGIPHVPSNTMSTKTVRWTSHPLVGINEESMKRSKIDTPNIEQGDPLLSVGYDDMEIENHSARLVISDYPIQMPTPIEYDHFAFEGIALQISTSQSAEYNIATLAAGNSGITHTRNISCPDGGQSTFNVTDPLIVRPNFKAVPLSTSNGHRHPACMYKLALWHEFPHLVALSSAISGAPIKVLVCP